VGTGKLSEVKHSCSTSHGLWRSLVAHLTGGQGVAGSNPVSPTNEKTTLSGWFFCRMESQLVSDARRRFVDLTPLRVSPAFARLWIGAGLSGIGAQMTIVAVGLQIYDITQNTFLVGLVGGIALIPMLFAGPWGGMLADSMDRRTVILGAITVSWLSTLGLVILSAMDAVERSNGGRVEIWPFYVFATINAMAYIISGAARTAVYPRILDIGLVPRATALSGISMGVQYTVGPALAGVLVATSGFSTAFTVDLALALAGFVGVVTLPKIPPLHNAVAKGWGGIRQGLAFLRTAPNIRTSFMFDIIAMSLGRPYAVLPAVAAVVIGGGPTTVGVLTAAAAVGTFATSLFSGPVAHTRRYGLAIGRAITLYGAFIAAFGGVVLAGVLGAFGDVGNDWAQVSWLGLTLAAICFFGMGASDEVSAIFRSTILLTAAPDEMRGRLQGVFYAVVAGGPRIGDFYTGLLAVTIALWAPALIGGIAIMVTITILLRTNHSFRNYDSRTPQL
jgi:MFS family permease